MLQCYSSSSSSCIVLETVGPNAILLHAVRSCDMQPNSLVQCQVSPLRDVVCPLLWRSSSLSYAVD